MYRVYVYMYRIYVQRHAKKAMNSRHIHMALFNIFDSLIDIIGKLLPDTNAQLPLQILRDLDLIGENVS